MDDVVDSGPGEHQRANRKDGQPEERGTLTKLLIVVQRQVSPSHRDECARVYWGSGWQVSV